MSANRCNGAIKLAFSVLYTSILVIGALLLATSTVWASNGEDGRRSDGGLVVVVVDGTGAVVPGAVVSAEGRGVETIIPLGETDGQGEGRWLLPGGEYRVKVTRAGFSAEERVVVISGERQDGESHLRIVLQIAKQNETVEARTEGYAAEISSAATRMPMRLLETPQQVEVLTGELLRTRGTESMKQAVEMVPAVGLQLGEGRRDNFYIRGFNAGGDMYLDGVRDGAQYYRDLSNTERIEVVEGPAAVLYGRGSSGGLINRVTKKPEMEGLLGELSYTAGSYGEQRGTADIDTLVPGTERKLGFRMTGAAEHEGSQRHYYWMDRYAFAPTVLWRKSDATEVRVGVERLRDDRLPDRGIPYMPATGAPAAVPVGNFYGYVGDEAGANFIHSAVTDGSVDVRHSFGDGWTVHGVGRLAGYATNFSNMYASSVVARADGGYDVLRGQYNGAQVWTLGFANVEAYRKGRWLGMEHMVLAGSEYGHEATASTQYNGPKNQTAVDLESPGLVAPVLSDVLSRNNGFLGLTGAGYVQDLVSMGYRWKALVGVRVDRFGQALTLRPPTNTTPNLGRVDWAASPRVGLIYSATRWASVYGNYSRTFDPSGEMMSLAVNNAQLKPEVTENFEGGAKMQMLHERLMMTASVFRLDRTNIKTTDPNDPTALLNLGEQRTNGAEFNFEGELTRRWHVYGGYAWLDGRIVSSTTLSNGVLLEGKRPAMTALHNGSWWTSYEFGRGLGLGAGLVGKAGQFAATDNLGKLPGFARVDAAAFYRRPRYEVQVNVQNVGNLRYYDAAQSDYQIYPAAPVSGSATVRWKF